MQRALRGHGATELLCNIKGSYVCWGQTYNNITYDVIDVEENCTRFC